MDDVSVVSAVDWLPTVIALANLTAEVCLSRPAFWPRAEPGLLAPVSINMRRPPNPFKVAKPRQVEPGLLSTMRGHDISPAFVGGGIPALRPADRPLLWEWRYNIEGPCYMEAPQLALLEL